MVAAGIREQLQLGKRGVRGMETSPRRVPSKIWFDSQEMMKMRCVGEYKGAHHDGAMEIADGFLFTAMGAHAVCTSGKHRTPRRL